MSMPRTPRSTNSSETISAIPFKRFGTGSQRCRRGSSSTRRKFQRTPAANGPPGRDWPGSQDLGGAYAEVVTFRARGSQTRQYNVLGTFTLKRISDIATLTEPPDFCANENH